MVQEPRSPGLSTVQQVLVAVSGAPPFVFALFSAALRPDLSLPLFLEPDFVTAGYLGALSIAAAVACAETARFRHLNRFGRATRGAHLFALALVLLVTAPASFVVALAPLVHAMGHPE